MPVTRHAGVLHKAAYGDCGALMAQQGTAIYLLLWAREVEHRLSKVMKDDATNRATMKKLASGPMGTLYLALLFSVLERQLARLTFLYL